ncbi:MAG TPA: acetyl-CoA C-acyltransferase [Gemmatimonadaceae bacterium]|nr:acetyl-CoA C-acyltransferase [Gemmatimonadaceae bacterium]
MEVLRDLREKRDVVTSEIVFLSAVRTPFGTFGGALRDVPVVDFTVHAAKAAIERAGISATDLDATTFGNVLYTAADSIYFSRHVALKSGLRTETPALTVNRLCGSGFQAIVSGAYDILLGGANACLVGGADSMSQAPHVSRGLRWGVPLGKSPPLEDSLWEALRDTYVDLAMGETAENLADKYQLSRGCVDEFAMRSQQLAAEAWNNGTFKDEVIGVPVRNPKTRQMEMFERDEHLRPQTTLEALGKLRPVFREDGVVTAGNASGIGDGAAALVIASKEFAKSRGLRTLGRLVSWGIAGVDPSIMGIGPVPAARIALERAGLALNDMDLIEVNEAFAPQACAVERELSIPREKLNTAGGAIALSHPLAASGARITAHLLHTLKAQSLRYGLGSACIGGGQGIALIVEATA